MSERLLSALVERGLFRFWIPRSLGGQEIDLLSGLRIVELVSTADGATGWTVMLGSGAGRFAAFLEPEAAREIFAPAEVFIAGTGSPTGIARETDDGYRVSGRWGFASGCRHATWFTANCIVHDAAGEVRSSESGGPLMRAVAVRAADVTIHETWQVSAMQGTGSHDFEIDDRFVPVSRSFSVLTDQPRQAGPLYRLPFFSVAELSFACVSLGIARHALEEYRGLAQVKKPTGSGHLLRDDPDVQARFARAEAAVRSARALVYQVAQQLWAAAVAGDAPSEEQRTGARLAAVDAVSRCARAVDLVYERAGMSPLFTSSAFGRAWRDIHTATQNMVVAGGLYVDVGEALLAPAPPAPD